MKLKYIPMLVRCLELLKMLDENYKCHFSYKQSTYECRFESA